MGCEPEPSTCAACRCQPAEQPGAADSSGDETDPEAEFAARIDRWLAEDGGAGGFDIPAVDLPRAVRGVTPVYGDEALCSNPASRAEERFHEHESACLSPEVRRLPADFDEEEAARARQTRRCVPLPGARPGPPLPDIPSFETPDLQGPRCEGAGLAGVSQLRAASGFGGMQRLDLTTKTLSFSSQPGAAHSLGNGIEAIPAPKQFRCPSLSEKPAVTTAPWGFRTGSAPTRPPGCSMLPSLPLPAAARPGALPLPAAARPGSFHSEASSHKGLEGETPRDAELAGEVSLRQDGGELLARHSREETSEGEFGKHNVQQT